jgi:hypothetical protein
MLLAAVGAVAVLVSAAGAEAKGDGPKLVTVGFGSVWVGLGSGEVREYDAGTIRLRRQVLDPPVGAGASIHGLVAAAGAVWVAGSAVIVRIDPRSGRTRALAGSRHVWHLAVGAGDVWAASDPNRVTRIDPRRGRIIATVRVPGRLWALGTGPGGVVVQWNPDRAANTGPAGPRVLRRLDTRTNRLTGASLRVRCDQQSLVGPRAVWTIDQCTGTLARRDPATLRAKRTVDLPSPSYTRPVLAFGSLWVAAGNRVVRVHPITLRVLATVWSDADALTAGNGLLWLLDTGDGATGTLTKVDPRTNRVVGAAVRVAP